MMNVDKLTRRLARRAKRAAAIQTATSFVLESFEPRVLLSSVMTDKQDYAFGETALINGSGFAAGELVQLQVQNDPGYGSNDDAQNQPWTVSADGAGNVSASWVVDDPDAPGAHYTLTAVGLSSNETAQTQFTDSITALSGLTIGAQTGTATAGTPSAPTFAVHVDKNGNNSAITWSVTSALPTGVTASFANNGDKDLADTTLTLTTTAATPAGTYSFNVQAVSNGHTATSATPGSLAVTFSTTTTLVGPGATSTYGQSIAFMATVTGNSPTGSVQFKDGAANLGSPVTLSGGSATLNTSALTATGSPHSITAVYIPDSTHSPSTSSIVSQTVSKASLSVVANSTSKTYGDANATLDGTLTGVVAGDGITASYSTSATQFSDVSTYVITATLDDPNSRLTNYNVTNTSGTLTINKANQTITWNDPADITYGTALGATQLNATAAGVPGGSAAGALAYTPISGTVLSAGAGQTLAVTAAATKNYNSASKNVTINVNKKTLSVTAISKSKTYGSNNPTINGMLTGDVASDGITASFSTTATQFSDAGGYAITATLNDPNNKLANYTVTNTPGTLTINKANQTITWNNPADITYGTALDATQLNAAVAGVAGGSAAGGLTYAPPAGTVLNAGAGQTLSVSAAGTTNYNPAMVNVTINVNKAALIVTADDQVRAKGAANPATSYTVSGLVPGDATTGTPTVTMPTVGAAQVGVFPISIAAGTFDAGSNYAVTFVPGKLTVTGVQINDGEAQRSMIRSIKVTFASPTAGTPTLTLTRRGGGSVSPTGSTTSDDGKTITYTFATGATPTLIDGIYDLSATDASQTQSLTFHRLFGDSNGDKKVDAADLAAVAISTRPGATYVWYFDFDGLNGDDTGDYNQAKARLGHTFAY